MNVFPSVHRQKREMYRYWINQCPGSCHTIPLLLPSDHLNPHPKCDTVNYMLFSPSPMTAETWLNVPFSMRLTRAMWYKNKTSTCNSGLYIKSVIRKLKGKGPRDGSSQRSVYQVNLKIRVGSPEPTQNKGKHILVIPALEGRDKWSPGAC